jgi:hypothetical protein
VRNCTKDEGGPFGFGNQVLISSHRKPLRSKAVVASVAETPGQDSGRRGRERRAQANVKGKGTSGSNREAESTDAPVRGGLLRSSEEAGVMPMERREQVIASWPGSTGNGRNPMFNGRRQPSCDGTSRKSGSVRGSG